MKTLALLTLLLIISGSAVGQMSKVNGFVGMDVLLPFNCSNHPKEVIWQKDKDRILNAQTKDPFSIDESYVNRTQLFINEEKGNCSLLLHRLSAADAGVYTSYALVSVDNSFWSSISTAVNLTVSGMEDSPETENQTGENSSTAVFVSVPILVVMLMLAFIILLTLLIKRYHRRNTDTDSPAEKPMLQSV